MRASHCALLRLMLPLSPTRAETALDDKHKQRLLVRFDDSETDMDREIDMLTRNITGLFRRAEALLQRIAASSAPLSAAERNVRLNIQR